jgi:hypothetical protein
MVDLYLDGGQDSDPLPSTALFCSSHYIILRVLVLTFITLL